MGLKHLPDRGGGTYGYARTPASSAHATDTNDQEFVVLPKPRYDRVAARNNMTTSTVGDAAPPP